MKRHEIRERFNLGGAGSGYRGHTGGTGGPGNPGGSSARSSIAVTSPDWGLTPGEYVGYRGTAFHGDSSKTDITFFSNEPKSAAVYNSDVKSYKLTLKNPKVIDTKMALTRELFGKSYQDMLYSFDKRSHSTVKANRALDKKIAKKLKSMGFDSLTLTRPQPPAKKEIGVFGASFEVLE